MPTNTNRRLLKALRTSEKDERIDSRNQSAYNLKMRCKKHIDNITPYTALDIVGELENEHNDGMVGKVF